MIPNASNSPFSAHQDVLEAVIPEDSSQKLALLEELKRRGKGAVIAQQWPDAIMLYEKALSAAESDDAKAILKSNIALSQGKMGKWKVSLQAAKASVELDETYVKGWWRLGQAHAALDDPVAAVQALERALSMEPANKALQKELEKMRAVKPKAAAESNKPTTTSTTTAEPKETKGLAKAESTSQTAPMEIDEDDTSKFTKSDHVRGYKIVNGKKTSFFHNELSEEAAKLIGDIAPKKLEQTTAEPTIQEDGVSVWNKAGTWEGRDNDGWTKPGLIFSHTGYKQKRIARNGLRKICRKCSTLQLVGIGRSPKSILVQATPVLLESGVRSDISLVWKMSFWNGITDMETPRGKFVYLTSMARMTNTSSWNLQSPVVTTTASNQNFPIQPFRSPCEMPSKTKLSLGCNCSTQPTN